MYRFQVVFYRFADTLVVVTLIPQNICSYTYIGCNLYSTIDMPFMIKTWEDTSNTKWFRGPVLIALKKEPITLEDKQELTNNNIFYLLFCFYFCLFYTLFTLNDFISINSACTLKRRVSLFWNESDGKDTYIVYYIKDCIGSSSCSSKCLYTWSSLSNTESSNQYREKDLKEMFVVTYINSYLSIELHLFIYLH